MQIDMYVSPTNDLILVPDCFLPSNAVQHRYGPLLYSGRICLDEKQCVARPWQALIRQIDQQTYAIVDAPTSKALWGTSRTLLQAPDRAARSRMASGR